MAITDPRVRRPKDKEVLIQQLLDEGPFTSMRDVLVFAAAVGQRHERQAPFEASGEPIRYDVIQGRQFADILINMIAVNDSPEDPEILSDARIEERLRIFEEYANGGLEIIQGELNRTPGTLDAVLALMVSGALTEDRDSSRPALADVVDELSWGALS